MGVESEFIPQECVFCKIARKEAPAYVIKETEHSIAFLDIMPANFGHIIVIPKKHYEAFEDIPEEEIKDLIQLVQDIVRRVKQFRMEIEGEEFRPLGVNILVNLGKEAGQVIKHIHIHVIPRTPNDNVYIQWKPLFEMPEALTNPQVQQVMEEIRKRLSEA